MCIKFTDSDMCIGSIHYRILQAVQGRYYRLLLNYYVFASYLYTYRVDHKVVALKANKKPDENGFSSYSAVVV
jgi:hypothetical protein